MVRRCFLRGIVVGCGHRHRQQWHGGLVSVILNDFRVV